MKYTGEPDRWGNSLPEYNQTGYSGNYEDDKMVREYGTPIYWRSLSPDKAPYGEPQVEVIWSPAFLNDFQNGGSTANEVMRGFGGTKQEKYYRNVPKNYGSFGRYNTRSGNTIPYEEWQRQNNALGDEYGSVGRYNNINSPRGNGANDPNYQSLLEILDNAFGGEEY